MACLPFQTTSFFLMVLAVFRMATPSAFISGWERAESDPHLRIALLNENDEVAIEREWCKK